MIRRLLCVAAAAALSGPLSGPSQAAGPWPASGSVEVLFSPWDDAEGALLKAVAGARRSVHVQAYLLTSRNLARALVAAHGRGVRVQVLADAEMAGKGDATQVPALAAAGIPVWLETRYAAAHNKVVIVDGEESGGNAGTVMTGSYNYTWSAQARNAENLLVLRGHPELTRAYLANWERHRGEATRWDGAK